METIGQSLLKGWITAIRNVKTAKLVPANGCDSGSEPSYRLLGGRALAEDPQKQELTAQTRVEQD